MANSQITDLELQREVEALRTRRRQSVNRVVLDPDLPDLHGAGLLPNASPPLDRHPSSSSVASSSYQAPTTPPETDQGAFVLDEKSLHARAPLFGSSQRSRYLARRNARQAQAASESEKGPLPQTPPSSHSPPNDPNHLFWVPAAAHPEISPADFRSFLKEQAERNVSQHEAEKSHIPARGAPLSPPLDGAADAEGEATIAANRLLGRSTSSVRRTSSLRRQIKPEDKDAEPSERPGSLLAVSNDQRARNRLSSRDLSPDQITLRELQRMERAAQAPPAAPVAERAAPAYEDDRSSNGTHQTHSTESAESEPRSSHAGPALQRSSRNMKLARPQGPVPQTRARPERRAVPEPPRFPENMISTIEALSLDATPQAPPQLVDEPESFAQGEPLPPHPRSAEKPRRGNTLPPRLDGALEAKEQRRAANIADVRAKVSTKNVLPELPDEAPQRHSLERVPVPSAPRDDVQPARHSEESVPRSRPLPEPVARSDSRTRDARPLPEPRAGPKDGRPVPEVPPGAELRPSLEGASVDVPREARAAPEPLRVEPHRVEPPRVEPPRVEPPRVEPPRVEPLRAEPRAVPELRPVPEPRAVPEPPRTVRPSTDSLRAEPIAAHEPGARAEPGPRTERSARDKRGFGLSWFGLAKEDEDESKRHKEERRKAKDEPPPPPPPLLHPPPPPPATKRKEKDTFLANLFGKRKSHEPQDSLRHRARTLFSNTGSTPPPIVPEEYPYTRFALHIERALYRLSHFKLANPRRALQEQVVISNLMFWYLAIVNSAQSRPADIGNGHQRQGGPSEYDESERRQCRGTPPIAVHTGTLVRAVPQFMPQMYTPYGMVPPMPWGFPPNMYFDPHAQAWVPNGMPVPPPAAPPVPPRTQDDYDVNEYVLDEYYTPTAADAGVAPVPSWSAPQPAAPPALPMPPLPEKQAPEANGHPMHARGPSAAGPKERSASNRPPLPRPSGAPRALRQARSSPSLAPRKEGRAPVPAPRVPPLPAGLVKRPSRP